MIQPALPLLLEPAELEAALGRSDLLILDTSSGDNYARHHVPGAIHISPQALQCGIKPAVGKLPSVEALSELFARVGLTPDKHVIAYDDEGGGWAGRLIWTLDVLGHKRYSYLNGGLAAWVNEGHPVETASSAGNRSKFARISIRPRSPPPNRSSRSSAILILRYGTRARLTNMPGAKSSQRGAVIFRAQSISTGSN